jgi:hypothetical protein
MKTDTSPSLTTLTSCSTRLGHLIFGLFGPVMGLYGGTLRHFVIPTVCLVAFWAQKAWVSVAVTLLWFFENFFNSTGYVADARSQLLPLVGGGEHNWTNILSQWGALQYDTAPGTIIVVTGWVGLLSTVAWVTFLWWLHKQVYADT